LIAALRNLKSVALKQTKDSTCVIQLESLVAATESLISALRMDGQWRRAVLPQLPDAVTTGALIWVHARMFFFFVLLTCKCTHELQTPSL
jgi:hypothetical protein